eukprot:1168336-Rhodomonas_salina.1
MPAPHPLRAPLVQTDAFQPRDGECSCSPRGLSGVGCDDGGTPQPKSHGVRHGCSGPACVERIGLGDSGEVQVADAVP